MLSPGIMFWYFPGLEIPGNLNDYNLDPRNPGNIPMRIPLTKLVHEFVSDSLLFCESIGATEIKFKTVLG